jgi:hypothetical protein
MEGDRISSLIMQTMDELRAQGILITSRAGEWCVNFRDGTEATAYVTDDLEDAFEHGRAMALTPAVAPETSAVQHRRKWRPPKSAKAARRAFIREHNRRTRARALREQRAEG